MLPSSEFSSLNDSLIDNTTWRNHIRDLCVIATPLGGLASYTVANQINKLVRCKVCWIQAKDLFSVCGVWKRSPISRKVASTGAAEATLHWSGHIREIAKGGSKFSIFNQHK